MKGETDHYTTQFVSGHGKFKAKLRGFNLVCSDRCVYFGVPEIAQHVLMECKFFKEERVELREFFNEMGLTGRSRTLVREIRLQSNSPGCAGRLAQRSTTLKMTGDKNIYDI